MGAAFGLLGARRDELVSRSGSSSECLAVSGRIQERDDAARHVQRAGARAVEPPPRTCLQELRNEYRL